ncbi:MAG: MFS transporter [Rhodobacteraceae bacterium]|jgi:MFS family permease|uniref:MFS transporter n=1 Tax=Roseovarius sp. 10 TaxID=3080563 RepID=UPI00193816EA|nr:MFS transporter [Roseovarius sp. 10]MBE1288532.1 MFS transporter [Paracoccaceae bacterium]MDV7199916.1 MFS transporter [Roseovarius sp. 10]QPI86003.1 MFS transporter [Rhodobacterales bacterium HKCCA1288]
MTTAQIDDRAAKRNVFVLILAQAFLGAQMPMIFVVGGLAGLMIAPSPALATIPISLIVFGSMTTAPWLSALMQKYGRRVGFFVGALGGALGAGIASLGLYLDNFAVFLIGSYLTGIYMSAHGFYRFAAADSASDDFRPRAISYVMAGGLLSALIGPQLVKFTSDATVVPFLGTYLSVVLINLIGVTLFFFLDVPPPKAPSADAPQARSRRELLRDPKIAVAIICGMVSYALMNLMMTSTPLAVVGCGFPTGTAADIVSAHVIAMYAPSFFTGHVIARFGAVRVLALGLFLLALAGVVALMGVELTNFFIALVLLGIGWNFGFIGATAMLTQAHPAHERGRVQGLNDFLVFGCVTLASLSSGVLMSLGETTLAGWNAVNIAMIPFLALAGAALIWLVLRPADEAAA